MLTICYYTECEVEFFLSVCFFFFQGNANEEPTVSEIRSPFVNDGQNAFCFDPR